GIKQGSFVGFFPYEKPKYTIAVLVRSVPGGAYYGGVVAAPVFKQIADKLYAMHVGGWPVPENRETAGKMNHLKKALPGTFANALQNSGYIYENQDIPSIGEVLQQEKVLQT